jgi:hypothetical protein
MSDSMTIANTILEQLNGNRFLAMTGAKDLVATGRGLRFKLPRAANGITHAHIELNARDTYTCTWYRMRRREGVPQPTVVGRDDDVYVDSLRDMFTRRTGLDTSL